MTTIDIIIVIIIGAGAIMGLFKGFIKQLAMIAGLVVGLIAAKALYMSLAEKICPTVTALFSKALEAVSLGAVNRLLGLVLGALKYVILIGLFINVLEFVDSDNRLISRTNKEQSVLYYPMKNFVGMFFPAVKEVTQQYIN